MTKEKTKQLPDNEGDLLTVTQLMPDIVAQTTLLIDMISKQNPYFVGYNIERISKEKEKNCIVEGIKHLSVRPLTHWSELHSVLNAWKDFYAPLTGSTMFVHRLPGFVIVNEDKETVLALVTSINTLKDDLANTIRHNRDKHQRHEFIHRAFSGVMTEQLYRKIQIKTDHVNNVWFNWVSRPVPQMYSLDDAVLYVEKKKSVPPIEFSATEWQARLNITISKITSGRYKKIQKLKQFRLLPTIEFNLIKDGEKKRNKHNATIPFILMGQENNAVPKFTPLSDFNVGDKDQKKPFIKSNKEMLDQFLQLVGVK
ncbi:MAG: hypothetical protein HRT51_13260 [Colwellia sp.]|nr:hypothetical protein [Colwellia sp.]